MRHRKAGRRLGRTTSHRKATMKNMAISLFTHKAIESTLMKCKELRRFAEPLITLAKQDNVANRRRAFAAGGDRAGRLYHLDLPRPTGAAWQAVALHRQPAASPRRADLPQGPQRAAHRLDQPGGVLRA